MSDPMNVSPHEGFDPMSALEASRVTPLASKFPIGLTSLLVASLLVTTGSADDFPELIDTEPGTGTPRMSAAEAARRWDQPAGLEVTVFACEPDVQNPIDAAWDSQGRLWVAENYTYAERGQRFQLDLRDRVVVLEDTDGDGRHDRRRVFTDSVQMLTGIEVGHGGVWLMCPPRLLFIPDGDRDVTPDGPATVVLDGFDVAEQNYHNFANGVRFGPDGWLYGRCGGSCPGRVGTPGTPDGARVAIEGGMWRYHPTSGRFEALTSGTTNPWGHDWNDVGELFFTNTVNGHFWHAIPGAHFTRPFTLDPNGRTYELIDFHADHWHFDTGKSWTESRDGAANDFGGGHAHCGLMIYQGDNWPESFRGRALTLNLHGRRANQEVLRRHGSGYVATHAPDVLVAADPWFRGMDLTSGPDGAVYVLDWSDTGECHEHTGVHRHSGRVYRVAAESSPRKKASSVHENVSSPQENASLRDHVSTGAKVDGDVHSSPGVNGFGLGEWDASLATLTDLHDADAETMVRLQTHPNAWYARRARLVLAERLRSADADRAARQRLSVAAESAAGRLRDAEVDSAEAVASLLTLHAAGGTDARSLRELLKHADEHVRVWAIRLLTESWPLDDCYGPTGDRSAGVTETVQWGRTPQMSQSDVPVADEPVADEPVADEPVADEPVADEPVVDVQVEAEAKALLPDLTRLAESDPSSLVRLTLASTLQRLPVSRRGRLAGALVSHEGDADDHNLPLMIWYGLMPVADRAPIDLVPVAKRCRLPTTRRLIARRLGEEIESRPQPLQMLLAEVATTADTTWRLDVLRGLAEALEGWRRAEKPDGWDDVVSATESDETAAPVVRELSVVFGDGRSLEEVKRIVSDAGLPAALRLSALKALIASDPPELREICEPLLRDARLNVTAAQGLASIDDPEVARMLVERYRNFRAPERPKIVSILASRASFASVLLDAIRDGRIPREALSAFQVRQIHSLGEPRLRETVAEVWGEVRESPEEKRRAIETLRSELTPERLAEADRTAGRATFVDACQNCHRLYGQGGEIGPDLTGGDRATSIIC